MHRNNLTNSQSNFSFPMPVKNRNSIILTSLMVSISKVVPSRISTISSNYHKLVPSLDIFRRAFMKRRCWNASLLRPVSLGVEDWKGSWNCTASNAALFLFDVRLDSITVVRDWLPVVLKKKELRKRGCCSFSLIIVRYCFSTAASSFILCSYAQLSQVFLSINRWK